MFIISHAVIGGLLARGLGKRLLILIAGAVGGAFPDIWANVPKLWRGLDYWGSYHFVHSFRAVGFWGLLSLVTLALTYLLTAVFSLRLNGEWRTVLLAWAGFFLGWASHVGIDLLWHKPEGGWVDWGIYGEGFFWTVSVILAWCLYVRRREV